MGVPPRIYLLLFGRGDAAVSIGPREARALWSARMNPRGLQRRRPRIRENINETICAPEVRAVFPDATVEIMPMRAALRRAREMGLDLILIEPTAEPPVAKGNGRRPVGVRKQEKAARSQEKVTIYHSPHRSTADRLRRVFPNRRSEATSWYMGFPENCHADGKRANHSFAVLVWLRADHLGH